MICHHKYMIIFRADSNNWSALFTANWLYHSFKITKQKKRET